MFQQHRDDSVQVRYLTRERLKRREQHDKVFVFFHGTGRKGRTQDLRHMKEMLLGHSPNPDQDGSRQTTLHHRAMP